MQKQTERVLLDASNLSVGGGVQVAASLVDELMRFRENAAMTSTHPWLSQLVFNVSPAVNDNLSTAVGGSAIHVKQRRWWQPAIWVGGAATNYDLQLTIFGPRYGRKLAPITVTGIADVTSVYAWPQGVPPGSPSVRLRRALRGAISRYLFNQESFVVSESESLLQEFHNRTGFGLKMACVIPNVASRAVSDPTLRLPLGVMLRSKVDDGVVLLAYVARLYPHKNHALLPSICAELATLGMKAKFVVTLTDEEWHAAEDDFKEACINVGVVQVNQVADLNMQCDAVVFPSLLESFSATPVEALSTNGLLIASDRPFVRDVCGDAAAYFDPLDPRQCARVVFEVLTNEDQCASLRKRASEVSSALPTAVDRALNYVELVTRLLANRGQL